MSALSERNTGNGERFAALGFSGSNHGLRTSFINNHFNETGKLPKFEWPIAQFPQSTAEEERVLSDVER